MNLIYTTKNVQEVLDKARFQGKDIGLVPTMGALHAGHLSLVKQCLADNDICIVSIFVNPTQFNNTDDLEKYPRTLSRDCAYLDAAGECIVFAPSVEEIYPIPDTRQFNFGQIDKGMEGIHRPGHFNGVAQVVSRLFEITKPNKAYFGQKDFQQLAVIRLMTQQLGLPISILSLPIIREASGLALSSRNERLTAIQRLLAANIFRILVESKEWLKNYSISETRIKVCKSIDSFEGLKVEYFEIVDGLSLQALSDSKESDYVVGCIAVFCGHVRLIDNVVYTSRQVIEQKI